MAQSNQPPTNPLYLSNNYCIMSKYSASKLGYNKDELLEEMIEKYLGIPPTRRTAQVNRGYGLRMMALELAVGTTISIEKLDCIIILGSGFDTLALRYSDPTRHWIEIDLPQVIESKCDYIEEKWIIPGQDEARVTRHSEGVTSYGLLNLHLISCDLRNLKELRAKLGRVLASIPERTYIGVVNEVCLCYLAELDRIELLRTLMNMTSDIGVRLFYIGLEQVRPIDEEGRSRFSQFALLMDRHFREVGFPLRYFPTSSELRDHYLDKVELQHVKITPLHDLYHREFQINRLNRNYEAIEPFDEYAEMDLFLSHYALVTGHATYNLNRPPAHYLKQMRAEQAAELAGGPSAMIGDLCTMLGTVNVQERELVHLQQFKCDVQRFGHAACVLRDSPNLQVALISGGFGLRGGGLFLHKRLNDCELIMRDPSGENQRSEPVQFDELLPVRTDRMFGQVCRLDHNGGLLFFSGGRQSPAKQAAAYNETFVALLVDHPRPQLKFLTQLKPDSSLRWRHRILKFGGEKIIQAGGLCGLDRPLLPVPGMLAPAPQMPRSAPLIMWNLSSDRMGWQECDIDCVSLGQLERHSFGMSAWAENLLIFGGLESNIFCDRPATQALLLDLRAKKHAMRIMLDTQVYSHQVFFINEHQFVRVGGISARTGLAEHATDLYDLRNNMQGLRVASMATPENPELFYMPINMESLKFEQSSQIVTYGGGGNFFTFGTEFNKAQLVYEYGRQPQAFQQLYGRPSM